MQDSDQPTSYAQLLHQWEETGAALANTTCTYLGLCSSLEMLSLSNQAIHREDIISQVDGVLKHKALHDISIAQLAQSQSILIRTRNRLASPIQSLPEVVLTLIFSYVLHYWDPTDDQDIEWQVREYYRRLYTMISVCTVWRNFVTSMGTYWSIIPIIRESHLSISRQTVSLCLSNSAGAPLDLVIVVPRHAPRDMVQGILNHTSRIKSIHIATGKVILIQDIFDQLVQSDDLGLLSELSLCTTDLSHFRRIDNTLTTMFSFESYPRLLKLIQSLTRLSLYGATIHWRGLKFSTKLIELRLQQLLVGSTSHLCEFIQAISSAVQLRHLTVISLYAIVPAAPVNDIYPIISLPNLQSLVLEDLHYDTLSIILKSIEPGTHKLTLYLTDKCLFRPILNHTHQNVAVDNTQVRQLFEGAVVDTLILGDRYSTQVMKSPTLLSILAALKQLKTLKLEECTIDTDMCSLIVSPEPLEFSMGYKIKPISEWHLTSAKIVNPEAFKELVLSHGVQTMVLSGALDHTSKDSMDWRPLCREDEIVEWLAHNISGFCFERAQDCPTNRFDFMSRSWQRVR
ncbi:unnamed protein product [Rhizoctonia solani]|uniref:F-box domain-containing protein n=1 Tax=Rhizoctonia solani TaxID=456999 RepID=A0A8H2WIA2_9AGAM|nr:unnamed protein product [Rhizoctonia solani]